MMMDYAPPNMLALMEKTGMTPEMVIEQRMASMARMYRAGVRLVTGNDSGIAPFLAHGLLRGSAETMVAFGASDRRRGRGQHLGGRSGVRGR